MFRKMETNEISEHLFRIYTFVVESARWVTSNEIAQGARVNPRTARAHASKLVKAGLFDLAEVFPAHRYRLSPMAEKRNKGLVLRFQRAREVFGREGPPGAGATERRQP